MMQRKKPTIIEKTQIGLMQSANGRVISKEEARKRLFIEEIQESLKQAKKGNVTTIKPEDL